MLIFSFCRLSKKRQFSIGRGSVFEGIVFSFQLYIFNILNIERYLERNIEQRSAGSCVFSLSVKDSEFKFDRVFLVTRCLAMYGEQ